MFAEVVPLGVHNVGHVERRSAAMQDKARHYYTCGDNCPHVHRWAARRLITPTAFLTAALASPVIADIAVALMVTLEDVNAYLDGLTIADMREGADEASWDDLANGSSQNLSGPVKRASLLSDEELLAEISFRFRNYKDRINGVAG